jgi:predicted nucleic-acid-binding protein
MKYESLDTNVILRFILRDIPNQFDAAMKLLSGTKKSFFASETVIFETIYVLDSYYQLSRVQIQQIIADFIELPQISCNSELIQRAIDLFVTHRKLSYADCYFAASSEFMNAVPLWTLDKDLAKSVSWAKLLA